MFNFGAILIASANAWLGSRLGLSFSNLVTIKCAFSASSSVAYVLVTKFEKLNPSLEPSHAFAEAIKIAPKLSKDTIIIVNSCGDAKKDRDILKDRLGKN